ncbi:hypothetical protein QYF61_018988, partial [Mycteria americana]
MTYKEGQRELGVFKPRKRSLMGDHTVVFQLSNRMIQRRKSQTLLRGVHNDINFFKGGSGGGGADLFSLVTSDRTRGNGMKLCQGKFRLDTRKRFFTERVVGHWNRLPREVVTALSLQVKDQNKKVANLKHKEQVEKKKSAQMLEEARRREDNLNDSSQQLQ